MWSIPPYKYYYLGVTAPYTPLIGIQCLHTRAEEEALLFHKQGTWGALFFNIERISHLLYRLRASPTMLCVWSCTVKLDEEKNPTCAGLAQEIGFSSVCNWARCRGWLTVQQPAEKSNKYDVTAAQCFSWTHHNAWSRWFAISSFPPICCPSFSFHWWGCKRRVHNY